MVKTTLVILTAILGAAPAQNQKGREEFERASSYYKAQEYEAALPLFQQAYELSGHRPSTIRALAQCERSLKMYDEAIAHFREYLETKPSAQEAKSVRRTIELLSELEASHERNVLAAKKNAEALDQTPAIDAAPVETTKPPLERAKPIEEPAPPKLYTAPAYTPPPVQPELTRVETEREGSTALPWATISASSAIAVAGGTLLAIGLRDMHKVEGAPAGTPYREVEDAANRAPAFTGAGAALIAAGLIGAGAGVAWLIGESEGGDE